MKVYMTGSHSCGKTTLARYVSEKYSLPLITEVARMVLSEKELQVDTLRYDLDVVDSYQKEVFRRQLLEEAKHFTFVSDRSAIDCLAYSAQHSRIFPELLASHTLATYIANLKVPDTILYFVRPSEQILMKDGVRETPKLGEMLAIDSMIKFILEMFEIKFIQIDTYKMQERVRLIDNTLSMIKI